MVSLGGCPEELNLLPPLEERSESLRPRLKESRAHLQAACARPPSRLGSVGSERFLQLRAHNLEGLSESLRRTKLMRPLHIRGGGTPRRLDARQHSVQVADEEGDWRFLRGSAQPLSGGGRNQECPQVVIRRVLDKRDAPMRLLNPSVEFLRCFARLRPSRSRGFAIGLLRVTRELLAHLLEQVRQMKQLVRRIAPCAGCIGHQQAHSLGYGLVGPLIAEETFGRVLPLLAPWNGRTQNLAHERVAMPEEPFNAAGREDCVLEGSDQ